MKFNYWAVIGLEGSGLGFEGSVLGLVLERGGRVVSASYSESVVHRFEYRRRHLVDA